MFHVLTNKHYSTNYCNVIEIIHDEVRDVCRNVVAKIKAILETTTLFNI